MAAAAASATLQSYSASPMAMSRAGNFKSYPSVGLSSLRSFPCKRAMRVSCQAEENQTPNEQPAKPTVSTKFSDVLAFSGPAPERINGRLAMIGFVAAMGVELARGDDLAAQLANGGLPWFAVTAAVLSAASLIPLFKGVSAQSKSDGLMTADAEMWNGRFAMLGLVALAFTEFAKGGPIV